MGGFFGKDWTGEPFVLFGPWHLLALGIIVLVNIGLVVVGPEGIREMDVKLIRWTLAAILIVDEIFWHLWNITTGQWSLQTTLPLHLCSVFVFLRAYMLVTKN